VTDIPNRQHSLAFSDDKEADGPFLRRILLGLIAATIFSGAVTFTLTTQHDLVERFQLASTHGPA
jgi:hypothetical protein